MWQEKNWKNKEFQKKKREKKKETDISTESGNICSFCGEIAVTECKKCNQPICKNHIRIHKLRYPPYSEDYCPKCQRTHYIKRIITVGLTVAVVIYFGIFGIPWIQT
ncbi:MAG: hypothetical protein ACTSWY_01395 [Promethearchaeota archaeon]